MGREKRSCAWCIDRSRNRNDCWYGGVGKGCRGLKENLRFKGSECSADSREINYTYTYIVLSKEQKQKKKPTFALLRSISCSRTWDRIRRIMSRGCPMTMYRDLMIGSLFWQSTTCLKPTSICTHSLLTHDSLVLQACHCNLFYSHGCLIETARRLKVQMHLE